MKTIAVLTSGGDSPGMNSSIRAVVRACAHYQIKCIGIIRGFSGLIENNTKVLSTRSAVSYTHLRAHETREERDCRLKA